MNLFVNYIPTSSFSNIPVDWLETDQAHIFKANIPGLKKEDVKVEVENEQRVIRISGEFKKDEVDINDKWHHLESPRGTFSRHFRLPENAMLDQVMANMMKGVMTLTIPKAAESKPNVIPIDISEN
ncbi:17.6 kDa class I heat shock protein-like [Cryptomeria japonica]|uniref:17.6 kDa class I heat shock protein-like n=1 Tax=Cryptomeria japonica TaxID=3369 RepID=UPI0027DA4363|nr:17.6 kDa class I heat shock protein-like [Cryptomeria japonica]